MLQAYPQGRPQEDPRVPLPWYVNDSIVPNRRCVPASGPDWMCFKKMGNRSLTEIAYRGCARGQEGLQPSQARRH